MTRTAREMVAVDPSTGRHLRAATTAEAAAYFAQPVHHPSFRARVRVGDVLVDEWTGYGGSHIPGRFLP